MLLMLMITIRIKTNLFFSLGMTSHEEEKDPYLFLLHVMSSLKRKINLFLGMTSHEEEKDTDLWIQLELSTFGHIFLVSFCRFPTESKDTDLFLPNVLSSLKGKINLF